MNNLKIFRTKILHKLWIKQEAGKRSKHMEEESDEKEE